MRRKVDEFESSPYQERVQIESEKQQVKNKVRIMKCESVTRENPRETRKTL